MSRKIVAFLIGIFLIGSGCDNSSIPTVSPENPPSVPEGFTTYVDDAGWEISYPEDWEPESSPANERQVLFYAPKITAEEFDHNIGVLYSTAGDEFAGPASLMAYAETTLYDDPVTIVEKTELIDTRFGQVGVIDYVATPEGRSLRGKELTVLIGSDVYLLVLTADEAQFDAFQSTLFTMLDSLVPVTP